MPALPVTTEPRWKLPFKRLAVAVNFRRPRGDIVIVHFILEQARNEVGVFRWRVVGPLDFDSFTAIV